MPIKLTAEEQTFLRARYKAEKDRTKAERINLILLLDKGYSQKEVAAILNLDEDTVGKWKRAFENRKDLTSWSSTCYVPYFGKISTVQMSRVRQYLATFKVSNKRGIRALLALTSSACYSLSGVQKLLTRIGLSHQLIHRLPGKCPVAAQQAWVNDLHAALAAKSADEVFLFMDAVHPTHNTTYSKIWTQKGQPRYMQSNTGRERLNICGAYNPDNQDFTFIEAATINTKSILELLTKIRQKYAATKRVAIYLDNATYQKNKQVAAFLAEAEHIELRFLPPYSPNLNLVERLWKFANEKVVNLKYYPFFSQFKSKILDFYQNIRLYKDELAQRITYKFQLFESAVV